MATWIALFRGINVGGKNIYPMAELKADLDAIGIRNARTYIQSGNVVFESSVRTAGSLAKKIAAHVGKQRNMDARVLVLSREDLTSAVESNPFPRATADPKSLHFHFLAKPPSNADLSSLRKLKAGSEEFKLGDSVFYLHAPDGVGRSKLASKVEKYLGVVTTARNWRTVNKLHSMLDD